MINKNKKTKHLTKDFKCRTGGKMKQTITMILVIALAALFAENMSLDTPMGSFKLSVDGTSSSGTGSSKSVSVIDEIVNRMDTLEKKYCSKLNKLDQKRAGKIMEEIYDLLAALPDDTKITISDATETEVTSSSSSSSMESSININVNVNDDMNFDNEPEQHNALPAIIPAKKAMSESEFNKFKNNVENESFGDDMLSVVRIGAKSKYFTTDQLVRLVDVFSFSDEKVETVRICWPKVVDQDNAHNLLGAFTYSDDKDKVESIINQ